MELSSAEMGLVLVTAITSSTTLITLIINQLFARQKAKDDLQRHEQTVASFVEVKKNVEVVRADVGVVRGDVEVVRTDVEVVRTDVDGKMKKLLEVTAQAENLRGQKEGRSEERAEQQFIASQLNPADPPISAGEHDAVIAVTAPAAGLLKKKADAPSSKGEHDAVIAVTADAAALLKKKADVDEKRGKKK